MTNVAHRNRLTMSPPPPPLALNRKQGYLRTLPRYRQTNPSSLSE
jgi:hypothetical protein